MFSHSSLYTEYHISAYLPPSPCLLPITHCKAPSHLHNAANQTSANTSNTNISRLLASAAPETIHDGDQSRAREARSQATITNISMAATRPLATRTSTERPDIIDHLEARLATHRRAKARLTSCSMSAKWTTATMSSSTTAGMHETKSRSTEGGRSTLRRCRQIPHLTLFTALAQYPQATQATPVGLAHVVRCQHDIDCPGTPSLASGAASTSRSVASIYAC